MVNDDRSGAYTWPDISNFNASSMSCRLIKKYLSQQKNLWSKTLAVNVQENANSVQPLNLPPRAKNMQKASSRIQWSFTFISGFFAKSCSKIAFLRSKIDSQRDDLVTLESDVYCPFTTWRLRGEKTGEICNKAVEMFSKVLLMYSCALKSVRS